MKTISKFLLCFVMLLSISARAINQGAVQVDLNSLLIVNPANLWSIWAQSDPAFSNAVVAVAPIGGVTSPQLTSATNTLYLFTYAQLLANSTNDGFGVAAALTASHSTNDFQGAANQATNGYVWSSLYDPVNAAKNATNNFSGANLAAGSVADSALASTFLKTVPPGATNWIPGAIAASIAASNLVNAASLVALNGLTGQVSIVNGQITMNLGTTNQFTPANAATLASALQTVPVAATNWIPVAISNAPTLAVGRLQLTNSLTLLPNGVSIANLNSFLVSSVALDAGDCDNAQNITITTSGNAQVLSTNYATITLSRALNGTNRIHAIWSQTGVTNLLSNATLRWGISGVTSNSYNLSTIGGTPGTSSTYIISVLCF